MSAADVATEARASNADDELRVAAPIARVDHDLVRAHAYASIVGVVIAATFGLLVATKFVWPYFLGETANATWGRLRYAHTQGLFFGWFGNVFLAFLYYAVPRLTDREVLSRRLGWIIFWAWNGAVLVPGWICLLLGKSQPLEWAELPLPIDAIVVVGLLLACAQFITPLARMRAASLYVSGWYVIGALAFTTLAYPIGNFVPELLPGAEGAAFSGLWTHDAVGLLVTPFTLAMIYFLIPAITRRPIYSHFLSLVGFWLNLLVYPLTGHHHYLLSPIPMAAQWGSSIASLLLGVNVVVVVTNLYLSLRGSGGRVGANVSLRFVFVGIGCYLLAGLGGAQLSVMEFSRLAHFTDWVIGHSHLAMIGFASFVAVGMLFHVWKHTPGVRYSERLAGWSFWVLLGGLFFMVIDLSIAGLLQGVLWKLQRPWVDALESSRTYWHLRVWSGVMLVSGFVLVVAALTTGPLRAPRRVDRDLEVRPAARLHPNAHVHVGRLFTAIFLTALGVFCVSFVALGWLPSRELHAAVAAIPEAVRNTTVLTPLELRGREVYVREGCGNCHTQQVRMTDEDMARFGTPTQAWEHASDRPHIWGTRRIGPDLAREAGIRPNDWQLVHLYDPRFVEPTSVMPAFPWLFTGSPSQPAPDGIALVAYLQSLGRAYSNAPSSVGGGAMPMGCTCKLADPAAPQFVGTRREEDIARGRALFEKRCTGCHGASGKGDGPAAASLVPHPADLTAAAFDDRRLSHVLWNGVAGTAMPRFRELAKEDLRALVSYVGSIAAPRDATAPAALVEAGRAVYRTRCASCHGASGHGDGPSEMALARLPADFHVKQPTTARASDVLEHGIAGTGMQAMAQNMTPAQREAVIAYVRSLYQREEVAP